MHLKHPGKFPGLGFWRKLTGRAPARTAQAPDRREYTLMVVPHHGNKVVSLRIPITAIKYSVAALSVLLVITVGTLISYRYAVNEAAAEKDELNRLRQINATQKGQIDQLAQSTLSLQEDLNRLNKLDSELRKLVNNEDTAASRSTNRPPAIYTGQGGPSMNSPQMQLSELSQLVQELQSAAQAREQSLLTMKEVLLERNSRLAATPSIWPAGGEVTSRFGWRNSPWGSGSDFHPGIDIASEYGTPIMATADGVVVHSGWYSGYGITVEIDHGNGIHTLYGHNSSTAVSAGTQVKKGEVVSYMGSTGYSTGTHVHYEVRVNGTAVNPANFL